VKNFRLFLLLKDVRYVSERHTAGSWTVAEHKKKVSIKVPFFVFRLNPSSGFLQNSLFTLKKLVFKICFATVWGMLPFLFVCYSSYRLETWRVPKNVCTHFNVLNKHYTHKITFLFKFENTYIKMCIHFGEATVYILLWVSQVIETVTFFTT
jgi:hypothetical protein